MEAIRTSIRFTSNHFSLRLLSSSAAIFAEVNENGSMSRFLSISKAASNSFFFPISLGPSDYFPSGDGCCVELCLLDFLVGPFSKSTRKVISRQNLDMSIEPFPAFENHFFDFVSGIFPLAVEFEEILLSLGKPYYHVTETFTFSFLLLQPFVGFEGYCDRLTLFRTATRRYRIRNRYRYRFVC